MASDSLVDIAGPRSSSDDIDSLPSCSDSDLYSDPESESESDAQAEWERSMEQLQLLLSMILVPWAGKLLGRKFAYWGWAKYMGWVHEGVGGDRKAFNAAGAGAVAARL